MVPFWICGGVFVTLKDWVSKQILKKFKICHRNWINIFLWELNFHFDKLVFQNLITIGKLYSI